MKKDTKRVSSEGWQLDKNGYDMPTQNDPLTGTPMCRSCWDGLHKRGGCNEKFCKCGCYNGRSKGLSFARHPKKGCEENQEFPDVGSFSL